MKPFEVSQSKVKVYLKCKLAYHYRYTEKLKRRVKGRPLVFGDIMHQLIEADITGEGWDKRLAKISAEQGKLFADEEELYGEILRDAGLIFQAYLDFYQNSQLKYLVFEKTKAEHWLEVDLDEAIRLVLKIDAFAKTKNNGLVWLVEHKTGKKIPDEDQRWRNIQTAVYLRACEIVGIKPFDGILWDFVLSKPPLRPQMTKSGRLSIKKIVTLPSVVRDVMAENKLTEKECAINLQRAHEAIPRWFERVFTPRNNEIIDILFSEFMEVAREMAAIHFGDRPAIKVRTIDQHCGWCDYESICRAELTGGDPDFVKEREYEVSSGKRRTKGTKETADKKTRRHSKP